LNPVHQLSGKKILFFGMLNYGKGVEYLIRAMNELPDCRLTVAGKAINPDYERIIKAAADENKLGNVALDIKWFSEEEKNKLLEQADLMVFPYVWAPYQSGTLHNAFSYGLPVVVTRAGALGEVVEEYRSGVIVEQRSPKAIASGIQKVFQNYEAYQQGVAKYRGEANWEKSAGHHAEVYNLLLQDYLEAHGIPEEEKLEKEMKSKGISDDADIANEAL
jgi:glycosyltransferase involved in cell wall biosynthesis